MSTARHRIRRQVMEVTIPRTEASWQLQSALGRIQSQSLEAIIDRCCTAAGDAERLHRIGSLEVDLGRLDADDLEQQLVRKLEPALREALTARIGAEDLATMQQGADPQTASRLELVVVFARTGSLPWWADATRAGVIDQTIALLLRRARRECVAVLSTLARDRRALRRIIHHCAEQTLVALFDALAAAAPPGLGERASELAALLQLQLAGTTPMRFRAALWLAALRAAGAAEHAHAENAHAEPIPFWRGVLAHLALELGVTYQALLTELAESLQPGPEQALTRIVGDLLRQLQEPAAAAHPPMEMPTATRLQEDMPAARREQHHSPAEQAAAASLPREVIAEETRLLRGALAAAAAAAKIDDADPAPGGETELEHAAATNLPVAAMREALTLLRAALDSTAASAVSPKSCPTQQPDQNRDRQGADRRGAMSARSLPVAVLIEGAESGFQRRNTRPTEHAEEATKEEPPAEEASADLTADPAPDGREALLSILSELERCGLPAQSLFAELRSLAPHLSAPPLPPLIDALKDLQRHVQTYGASAAETAHSFLRTLRTALASVQIPAQGLADAVTELERAALREPTQVRAATTALRRHVPPMPRARPAAALLDLAYSDSSETYVENAGLVILWPFLRHLFERLELLDDKLFKDRDAQHRAVNLLQHLVTEDPAPPEYQLLLAKVLCGMERTEVVEPGPPVTPAEAEECTNLLTAVIANAPILKDMSIAGLRGSFLLRKGVLSVRDGAWLLRVERASYDVVLDRFPWGLGWIKLPWTEVPLCVEW